MFFFFNDTATTEIYTLSLHDALPICRLAGGPLHVAAAGCLLRCGLFWVRDTRDSHRRCARKTVQRSEPHLETQRKGTSLRTRRGWAQTRCLSSRDSSRDQTPGLGEDLSRTVLLRGVSAQHPGRPLHP